MPVGRLLVGVPGAQFSTSAEMRPNELETDGSPFAVSRMAW